MEDSGDKKEYEIAFLTKDETGAENVGSFLKQHEAEIIRESAAKKINLAYKIKKEPSAYFGCFHFAVYPEKLKTIDHDLKINPAVLRFLITTPPFIKQKPAVLPKTRGRIAPVRSPADSFPKPPLPLSNEALEKKIEEILR